MNHINTYKLILAFVFTIGIGSSMWAQVKIGDNVDVISPYALLELESTSLGLILPRMTTAQRDLAFDQSTPNGTMIFNTDEQTVEVFSLFTDPQQGVLGRWTGVSGGGDLKIDSVAPSSPSEGDLYFDTQTESLNLYFNQTWFNFSPPSVSVDGVGQLSYQDQLGQTQFVDLKGFINLPDYENGVLTFTNGNAETIQVDLADMMLSSGGQVQELTLNGTTTVNGAISLKDQVLDGQGNPGLNGQILSSTGTSTIWVSTTNAVQISTKSISYQAQINDGTLLVSPSNAVEITLPLISNAHNGVKITIKRANEYQGNGDTLSILTNSANVDDSSTAIHLNVSYQGYTFQAMAGEWHIVQRY